VKALAAMDGVARGGTLDCIMFCCRKSDLAEKAVDFPVRHPAAPGRDQLNLDCAFLRSSIFGY